MKQSDIQEFFAVLEGTYALYNQKEPSDFVKQIWLNAMKNFDMDAIRSAFSAHITCPDNGQFMPKPADIVRMIGGTNQDRALKAWSDVDYAVRHYGTYEDVVFDDPVIHAVLVDMGGWIKLGTRTDDEWDFVKNEFVSRYRGYSSRQETPEYVPVLTGISNAYNSKNGYKTNPPLLLGNKEKAQQVYLGGNSETVRLPKAAMQLLA